jgi:hypothetical protein
MKLYTQVVQDMLLNQLRGVLRYTLFKGSVAGLPLICTEGGAPGYKSAGRSRIHDSITIINSINSNLMSKCSACLILTLCITGCFVIKIKACKMFEGGTNTTMGSMGR